MKQANENVGTPGFNERAHGFVLSTNCSSKPKSVGVKLERNKRVGTYIVHAIE